MTIDDLVKNSSTPQVRTTADFLKLLNGESMITSLLRPPDVSSGGRRSAAAADTAPKSKGQQLFNGQKDKKKQKKISVLDQWVEVTVVDGRTVTELHPPNDELIERGQRMSPPPVYVYRRFNFVHHVPAEYHWVTQDERRRQNGGMCLQRMTVDTWLEVIEREKLRDDGHIGITGVGNMPRPKERGGCDCPVCTANAPFFPGV